MDREDRLWELCRWYMHVTLVKGGLEKGSFFTQDNLGPLCTETQNQIVVMYCIIKDKYIKCFINT